MWQAGRRAGRQAQPAFLLLNPALPRPALLLHVNTRHHVCMLCLQVWFQALEATAATGLLPPPEEAEYPAAISWLSMNAACALLLGEGGRVFVQPAVSRGGGGGGDIVELRWVVGWLSGEGGGGGGWAASWTQQPPVRVSAVSLPPTGASHTPACPRMHLPSLQGRGRRAICRHLRRPDRALYPAGPARWHSGFLPGFRPAPGQPIPTQRRRHRSGLPHRRWRHVSGRSCAMMCAGCLCAAMACLVVCLPAHQAACPPCSLSLGALTCLFFCSACPQGAVPGHRRRHLSIQCRAR